MIFNWLDTMNNKDRKRFVLINYNSIFLKLNNLDFDISNIIRSNGKFNSISYKLSGINANDKIFIVKPFEKYIEFNLDFLIDKKDEYINFSKDLIDLLYIENYDLYIDKLLIMKEKYIDLIKYEFNYSYKLKKKRFKF